MVMSEARYIRLGKRPPKVPATVKRELKALDDLADVLRSSSDIDLCARVAGMRYALSWQQGNASQQPSDFIRQLVAENASRR